jgi:hypothetical protein
MNLIDAKTAKEQSALTNPEKDRCLSKNHSSDKISEATSKGVYSINLIENIDIPQFSITKECQEILTEKGYKYEYEPLYASKPGQWQYIIS